MIPPIVERDAAGLPRELSVHCLRHSFVSHLGMTG
jgi:site-specific recombinase XerD